LLAHLDPVLRPMRRGQMQPVEAIALLPPAVRLGSTGARLDSERRFAAGPIAFDRERDDHAGEFSRHEMSYTMPKVAGFCRALA
jgi:hypothetical protein